MNNTLVDPLLNYLDTFEYNKTIVFNTEQEYEDYMASDTAKSVKIIELYNCSIKTQSVLQSDAKSISAFIEQEFIKAGVGNIRYICEKLQNIDIVTYLDFICSFETFCQQYNISNCTSLRLAFEAKLIYGQLGNHFESNSFSSYIHFLCRNYEEEYKNVSRCYAFS